MKADWSESTEREFEQQRQEDVVSAYGLAQLLAVTLFPVFSGLDYLTQRDRFEVLSIIRFSTSLLFLALIVLQRRRSYTVPSPLGPYLVLSISGVSLVAMCVVTGGHASRYYGGPNLVIAAAALFPWRVRDTLAIGGMTVGLYFVAVMAEAGFRPSEPEVLVNNLYFMLSTACISTAITWLSDRLRRRSFKAILARRALESRDQFISEASHELRTPLTALQLQIGLMEKRLGKPALERAELTDGVAILRKQARRLAKLVDEMLDLSRIRSGKLELRIETLDFSSLVRQVLESQLAQFSSLGIPLDSQVQEGILVRGDEFRLEQVMTNLVSNALKYGESRPVRVRAWSEGPRICFEVQDQGVGIVEEHHDRVFERFERPAAPANVSGLGLGLFISREIVNQHGGQIKVRSAPGKGSSFTVVLPAGGPLSAARLS